MEAHVTASGVRLSVTPLTDDGFQILAQSFKDRFEMRFGV